jgi:cyclophilin family peptidyl-prolyl cis-trans isomerase
MTLIRALARLAAGAALAAAALPLAAQAPDAFLPDTVPVQLDPAQPEAKVGELIFRGGVEIAPDKADIGGISSLEWHGNSLFAVTDDGRWMELETGEVAGKLVDVSGVRLGPLLDPAGKMLDAKKRGDAEALTRLPSGEWLVAFEQEHRIWRYADIEGPAAGAVATPDIAAAVALVTGADANAGLETIAAGADTFLACGEWVDAARPNCVHASMAGITRFHLPAPEGIAEVGGVPTDATCKADGTCYVLFRSYTPGQGNRAAVIALSPDKGVTPLAILAPPLLLDNFEGLAVREEAGRTFLYMVSDDNFQNCAVVKKPSCQRNLLYKFEVAPPPGVPAAMAAARPGVRPHPQAASATVVLETSLGPVTIALETERAPVTAGNFLRYVEEKRFDGTSFYRAMMLGAEGTVAGLVQGGTRNDPKRILPPVAHEPTSATGLTHTHGALSMAMLAPGGADGDFFILIEDQTGFDANPATGDPGYAVFGYVTGGMDIVTAILAAPRDAQAGEGVLKGQMLAAPVTIISARRVAP